MHRRTIVLGICCMGFLWPSPQAGAGGITLTPLQTRSTSSSGVLAATNWSAGTSGINDPVVFNQFNPKLGTLTAIDITLTTTVRNDYIFTFSSTATIDVATSQTSDPSILNDPARRSQLTDGPSVSLLDAKGVTPLFGGPGRTQPVDFVQLTESSGTYKSTLPITSPFYVAPTITQQTLSRSVTDSDSLSLLSEFIGTGTVGLPVTATAFSSYFSNSGNGGGAVITTAVATITIQYEFLAVPEPSSILLLGLGVGISLLANSLRRRAARLS